MRQPLRTLGLGDYAKEHGYSFKRVRCPLGRHDFDTNGKCACGHVPPRAKEKQSK